MFFLPCVLQGALFKMSICVLQCVAVFARRPFQDVYLCVAVCCSVCCKPPFSRCLSVCCSVLQCVVVYVASRPFQDVFLGRPVQISIKTSFTNIKEVLL